LVKSHAFYVVFLIFLFSVHFAKMRSMPSRLVRRFNHTPSQYDVLTPSEWSQLLALAQANHWSPYPAYSVGATFIDEILKPPPTVDHFDIDDFVHFLTIFCSQQDWIFTVVWNSHEYSSSDICDLNSWTYFCLVPVYPPSGSVSVRVVIVRCGESRIDPQPIEYFDLPDPVTVSKVSLRFSAKSTAAPLCRVVARCFSIDL
jgi:hypothetical protein